MSARGGTLAIDHGERHTGFAFADALGITQTPLATYHGPGGGTELLEHVAQVLEERDVGTFVVGLPLNADGSEGPRCVAVRAFAARLAERFPRRALAFVDEHLTSKEAEARLSELGRGGRAGRAERDAYSALILLEDFLRSRA
ncbi:MAG TPA: Holliday junction resolvase RuvX [Planctomycetota bacterium]|nr:Holliday junction resolvase RuvX [Planctomycetota bacterium]